MNESKLTHNQKIQKSKMISPYEKLTITIRYDDECGNGHNSFAITGSIHDKRIRGRDKISMCGYIHEEIEKHFPEYAHLIQWHLCNSDGPMRYLANTTYHANDKDCWGLRKGEKRQILAGGKIPAWRGVVYDCEGNEIDLGTSHSINSYVKPEDNGDIKYIPWCQVGEGKEPDLEAARSCAIWPEATLSDLQSKEKLLARLPQLLKDFRADMEALGFTY